MHLHHQAIVTAHPRHFHQHMPGEKMGIIRAGFPAQRPLEIFCYGIGLVEGGTLPVVGLSVATVKTLAYWVFVLAFAIKVPVWPFNTWLPDAHTEAPTAGSVLLAGVLLKLGTYGFLRLALPTVPEGVLYWAQPMAVLAMVPLAYGMGPVYGVCAAAGGSDRRAAGGAPGGGDAGDGGRRWAAASRRVSGG